MNLRDSEIFTQHHILFEQMGLLANKLQIKAYLIGGFVRDLILEKDSKDIDIVVVGDGVAYAKELSKELQGSKLSYFENFGTAQILHQGLILEVVGARKESYRSESRKPSVSAGTLIDDQNRRDLTINAMGISLNPEDYGQLLDPFNGLQDIELQIVRTPLDPDKTFSDDPLRMMRAIRFASKLGYKIDEETFDGIARNKERIKIISQERITDELNKIILSPMPSIGFEYLFDTGLLEIIFPEMYQLHGVETVQGKSHKDNFYHTIAVLDNLAMLSNDLWLRWAAILHDIAKPATKRFEPGTGWTFHGHEDRGSRMVQPIFRKLKLPLNEKMKMVEKLVLLHLRPIVLASDKVTDSAVRRLMMEAGEDIDSLMLLCKSDITSKNEKKVERIKKNFEIVLEKIQDVGEKDYLRNWQPPITGNDILENFKIEDKRHIGVLKAALKTAILEGEVEDSYDASMNYLKKLAGTLNIGLTQQP